MAILSTTGRAVAAAATAAALMLALAACGSVLPKDQVASTIGTELGKQGIQAENVTCPEDLQAEVGKSLRCEFTTGGQPVDVVATVTSIQGDTANYDIKTEARPIAKALLAKKVGEQVGQQAGVTVDSTDCAGDLQPKVGESTKCTVKAGAEVVDFEVTVTAVDGGQINYSINTAA